jgi:hypothetical protein
MSAAWTIAEAEIHFWHDSKWSGNERSVTLLTFNLNIVLVIPNKVQTDYFFSSYSTQYCHFFTYVLWKTRKCVVMFKGTFNRCMRQMADR